MKQNALQSLKELMSISSQELGGVLRECATPEFEEERKKKRHRLHVPPQPAGDLDDWPRLAREAQGLA